MSGGGDEVTLLDFEYHKLLLTSILISPREDDRQKPLATYPLYIFLRILYL